MRFALLCVVVFCISWFVATASSESVTAHDAKLATFKLLLRETEQRADVNDQTGAAITVSACSRRVGGGWKCRGELDPVYISGIQTRCRYVVSVSSKSARITFRSC